MFEFHPGVKVLLHENGHKDLLIKSPTITLVSATSHPVGPEVQEVIGAFSDVLLKCTLPGVRHQRFSRCWDHINYPPGEQICTSSLVL